MKSTSIFLILLFTLSFLLPADFAHAVQHDDKDFNHRDSFVMNSVGGGDFRSYILDNVTEDNSWAYSMRTFGIFHNLMHELMSDLVRYEASLNNSHDRIPDFTDRISGGGWTEYRENIESASDVGDSWLHFVRVTEIMHDRVHQAMYKSILYDMNTFERDISLEDYVGKDRAPHATEDTFTDYSAFSPEYISSFNFLSLAWQYDTDDRYLHASLQQMTQFSHMLTELLTIWTDYASNTYENNCQPEKSDTTVSTETFSDYASGIYQCEHENWRNLIRAAELMQIRIHQMMAAFTAYLDD